MHKRWNWQNMGSPSPVPAPQATSHSSSSLPSPVPSAIPRARGEGRLGAGSHCPHLSLTLHSLCSDLVLEGQGTSGAGT